MDRVRALIGLNRELQEKFTGEGITAAILDSGIAAHEDFGDRILAFSDFVSGRGMPYDDNGHGTHIAGILAGSGKRSDGRYAGIAPGCGLVIGKVLNRRGSGNLADILKGISWCMEHRELYNIRIINISVGMTKDTGQKMEERLLELIEEAWAQGMVVVCAAGNNGPSPGSVTIPGNSRTVITVGAVDENGRGMSGGRGRGRGEYAGSMSYSGRGPTRECVVKPEILAPGTDIVSCGTTGGYTKKTGTSMAVPVVSGAVAMMLEKDPALAPVEVKLRMYERCIPLRYPYGSRNWGRIYLPYLLL